MCYIVLCHSPGCTESVLNGLYDQLVLDPIGESRLWLLHISIFTHLGTRPTYSPRGNWAQGQREEGWGAIERVWRPWAHLMYDKNAWREQKKHKTLSIIATKEVWKRRRNTQKKTNQSRECWNAFWWSTWHLPDIVNLLLVSLISNGAQHVKCVFSWARSCRPPRGDQHTRLYGQWRRRLELLLGPQSAKWRSFLVAWLGWWVYCCSSHWVNFISFRRIFVQ